MRTLHRQHGGTFVGIIIGLIIGLGIALAVAVAITKTPMPFTNKVTVKDKTDKPAAAVDVSADPNKPLYGNRARPKDVVKNDSEAQTPNKTADSDKPDTLPTDKPSKVEIKAAASKDPIKDIIASKTEAKGDAKAAGKIDVKADIKPEAKNDSADAWTYFLQTGAFNDQNDAEGSRAKLALMGVEAQVSEKPSPNGNGVLYRVRVGPFVQLDAANKVRSKLSDNGINATMVRIAK